MDYTPTGLVYLISSDSKLEINEEMVDFYNDMISEIDKDYKKFIKDLEIELKQLYSDNNRCEICGGLSTTRVEYENSNCRGFNVSEEINRPYCEECKCYLDD